LTDAKQAGGFDLLQATPLHNCVDFENQLGLDEVLVRILYANVFEDVLTPCGLSFAIRPAPAAVAV
jgi:hypothetical protein